MNKISRAWTIIGPCFLIWLDLILKHAITTPSRKALEGCYVNTTDPVLRLKYIKGIVHLKLKISHYLLTFMPIEGRVYFVRPQNTAGVSEENGVAESPKECKTACQA